MVLEKEKGGFGATVLAEHLAMPLWPTSVSFRRRALRELEELARGLLLVARKDACRLIAIVVLDTRTERVPTSGG